MTENIYNLHLDQRKMEDLNKYLDWEEGMAIAEELTTYNLKSNKYGLFCKKNGYFTAIVLITPKTRKTLKRKARNEKCEPQPKKFKDWVIDEQIEMELNIMDTELALELENEKNLNQPTTSNEP